jgi:hypothetical protein
MKNEKLELIAKTAARNLIAHFDEMEDDIQEAINAATEQAEDDGKETIKVSIPYGIALDFAKGTIETKLSVNVKHTTAIAGRLPDPNQPELDLDENPEMD